MPHKDPEIRKAYHRDWHARHRAAVLARMKQDYKQNKEQRRAYMKKYYADRPGLQKGRNRADRLRNPWKHLLRIAKQRASKKGVAYSLTPIWAAEKWTGFCELSGIQFVFRNDGKSGPLAKSPSIDRIEPSKGYVPDNCRFILHCINSFKHDASEAEMLSIARAILERSASNPRDTHS